MDRQPDVVRTAIEPGPWPSLSSEDGFGHIIDVLPVALVLTGLDGRIELANRRAEAVFGYDNGELHGQHLEVLMPECFRSRHADLRARFTADSCSRVMGEGWNLPGRHKDGTEFPLEIGLAPINLDGQPMTLASIIDITTRHAHEQEKEEKHRELERSNSDLEEFAYAASHDLKAPLRAISHLVQWIGEDIGSSAGPDTRENLRLLEGRVAQLQLLMDGLLAYARIGRGTKASAKEVDTGEVVRDVVAMLAPPAGFVVACPGPMPVIRTHRAPLEEVFENLIGNALKHHDRTEGRVTVAARLADGIAEFRVSDDGPGIPPRFHDRIFLIFQTLASRDDVESSGIGLAIVKKRVQGHGGEIRVESAPPTRGATFIFTWKEAAP